MKKIKLALFMAGGVLVIVLVAYLLFFLFQKKDPIVNNTAPNVESPQAEKETKVIKPSLPTKTVTLPEVRQENSEEVTERDIKKMAASFAERFGSYSNQSNFSNISDLHIFMSAQMKIWSDNYIVQQKANQGDTSIYYGIVTKAVTQELVSFDEEIGQAVILVKTRRREATMTTNNTSKIFNQNIIISFVKENDAWKVSSATWQN